MELKETIKKYVVKNIYDYGSANIKAIFGKIVAENKEVKKDIKGTMELIKQTIEEYKDYSKEQLEEILKSYTFVKKEQTDPLKLDIDAITRFMPEPNGYLHIGHAKAAFLNYEVAKRNNGYMVLRIDDTNPEKEKQEYVDEIKKDLEWLGIGWKKEIYTSDYIEELYSYAEQLIEKGKAYVCTCDHETIKKNRREGNACQCRARTKEENKELFSKLKKAEIKGILRYKGDLKSLNTAMRDPTLMRIVEKEHYRQGNKYKLWPNYDFSAPITDSIFGITVAMRSKEYELREELYYSILEDLNLRKPKLIHFARLNIKGMPISKRLIKPLIEKGKVEGWDDPRLPTIKGLRRRGIVAQAIKNFVLSFGIGKAESNPDIEKLLVENRKILDKQAEHRFFIPDPKEIEINFEGEVNIGRRTFKVNKKILVPKEDYEKALATNKKLRLKDWKTVDLETKELSDEKARIVQWVAKEQGINCKVIVPDVLYDEKGNIKELKIIEGVCEDFEFKKAKIIQFERFGYCIIDSTDPLIFIKSC